LFDQLYPLEGPLAAEGKEFVVCCMLEHQLGPQVALAADGDSMARYLKILVARLA